MAKKTNRAGTTAVDIELLCSLQNDTTILAGERQQLAADFTIPWAALLSRTAELNRAQFFDILTAAPIREPRLYLMESYDPNKEPVIMIHGLLDTPLAFAKLSNELWADDAIRRRYQIWHYLYKTSAPALYSGRLLQSQLRELRGLLDPSGQNRAMQSTTFLAHSMGGIVTRRLITEPESAFWDAAFKNAD
jgi:pimeloyl-ACP methyl ester carboxylesterase